MKLPFRLGFIGLGIMGKEMLKNLIKDGYKPVIYNRTLTKCFEFEKEGCSIAPSPSIMAEMVEAVIIMVENDDALRDVIEGSAGIFSRFKAGNYIVNMSTISFDFSKYIDVECRKRGIKFLDCPVVGSKKQAENRELLILASGEERDVEKFSKIFLSMGGEVIYTGQVPNSTALKLSVNLIIAFMTVGITEATLLSKKLGINPLLLFDTLKKSPVLNCGFFRGKEYNLIYDNFETSFSIKNITKDIGYIIKAAEEKNLKIYATEFLKSIFEKAIKSGYFNEDITAIKKTY
ncbi:MAG: NAD(P)-dependent oxidoreductase [Elusimicrobiales bacterium]